MSLDDKNPDFARQPLSNLLVFLLFLIVALVSYLPALPGPFVLDDIHTIAANRHLKIEDLSIKSLTEAGLEGPSRSRPLPKITFAINYYLHGDDVRGFRAVNVGLHALAAMGLFLFLKALMATPAMLQKKNNAFSFAFWASFLWLAHPAATQSVSYIVQRMAVLAAVFIIFSLYFFIRARLGNSPKARVCFWGLCILSGIMALLSKENAAMLLLLIPLCEWFFFQNLSQQWARRAIVYALPVGGLFVLLFVLYSGMNPYKFIIGTYEFRDFTLYERLLTQFRVVVLYLGLIVFPLPASLNLFRDVAISKSLFAPFSTFLSLIFLSGLLAFALIAARRMRFISFALLFFFITLAPESTIIGLEIAFDHRTYLPSMLIVAAIVMAATGILHSNKIRIALFCVLALLCFTGTSVQNRLWGDRLGFFYEGIKRSPQSLRAWSGLSNALILEGYPQEALAAAQQGVDLGPDDFFAWRMLGRVLLHPEINRPKEAEAAYKKAIEQSAAVGNKMLAYDELHAILVQSGKFEEADELLKTALSIKPDNIYILNNAGRHFLGAGQAKKAQELFEEAVSLDPAHGPSHENLGISYAQTGQWEKALIHFEDAARLARPSADLLCNMGMSYLALGQISKARSSFMEALEKAPTNHTRAYEGLGLVAMRLGDYNLAAGFFEAVLEQNPNDINAIYNMTSLFSQTNRNEKAAQWAARLFEAGFSNCSAFLGDDNLYNLRQSDYGKDIIRRYCLMKGGSITMQP